MNKIVILGIMVVVALILVASLILLLKQGTQPAPVTGKTTENTALSIIEEELEQTLANMTGEEIESALLSE